MPRRAIEIEGGLPPVCAEIRRCRLAAGLGQKELAERVGVHKNAVSNWETGKARPDLNLFPALCAALRVGPAELLGLEEERTPEERELLERYRSLTPGHRYALRTLAENLAREEAETRRTPRLRSLPYYEKPLAAGIGDPTEDESEVRTLWFYESPELRRADCVYRVSGDSMEPLFRDGDLVFVERIPEAAPLRPGEIGAFIVGNELYIKQYEREGLRSLNERYPLMRFEEADTGVYLLGRVLGTVDPALLAPEAGA